MFFSDFSGICDKNFIVSYLTPSIIFVSITILLATIFFPQIGISSFDKSSSGNISESSVRNENYEHLSFAERFQNLWEEHILALAVAIWIVSILLRSINLQLIRFLEGYGLLQNSCFRNNQLNKFDNLVDQIESLSKEYDNGIRDQKTTEKYIELMNKYRTEYPSDREYVLPTSFGNIIRSFEVYSKKVYGIDAIPVWTRIFQVCATEHRKSINDDKAQVDFAVNIYYLMIVLTIQYMFFAIITFSMPLFWIPLIALFFAWLSYNLALTSAKVWGENVKSVFDLYRYDLLFKMGIKDITNEREKWENINQLFLYWDISESDDEVNCFYIQ